MNCKPACEDHIVRKGVDGVDIRGVPRNDVPNLAKTTTIYVRFESASRITHSWPIHESKYIEPTAYARIAAISSSVLNQSNNPVLTVILPLGRIPALG